MATQVEIASHLDLSDRQVRTLVRDGVLPAGKGRGGYDLDGCRTAYIRYLRGLHSGKVKPEADDLEGVFYELERARLTKEQRIGQALKNAQSRRELAPVQVIEFVLAKVGNQISDILDAIPLKVKRRMPKMTSAQVEIIRREIVKCQNTAARISVDLDEYRDERGDPEGGQPGAEVA